MASQAVEIMAALAALSVAGGTKTPDVLNADELTSKINAWPRRVILPYAPESAMIEGHPVGLGTGSSQTWQFTDLCLWQPIKGSRLGGIIPDMWDYCINYVTALRANLTLGLHNVGVVSWAIGLDSIEWPEGTEAEWHAIIVVVEVEEFITG